MFTSEKVEHHLQTAKFGGDKEKPTIVVSFYKTPLTFDLCYELDDRIAKQLFRREGKNYIPVSGFGKTVLNLGEIGAHNVEIYPHDAEGADGSGQMVAGCLIGEVYVDKLFKDSNDWSLIWKAVLPMDSHSLELVRRYYKNTLFITLEKAQGDLPLKVTDDDKPIILSDAEVRVAKEMHCEVCSEPATYLGADLSAWCNNDVKAAVGIQVRQIVYDIPTEAE